MKTNRLSLAATFWTCWVLTGNAQCFRTTQRLLQVDLNNDGIVDWSTYVYVTRDDSFPQPFPEYFLIRTDMHVGPTSRVLRSVRNGRIEFELGETISPDQAKYLSEPYHNADVWLLRYRCSDITLAENIDGEFLGKNSLILGTTFTDPDTNDVTLGWFKFSRPSTAPGTAFTLESWAYNPIPNEPIRAGFPPDLPVPQFAFSGENSENLDVSWPAKASTLRLETTDSLTPPVQWKPVDTGGATAITLPAGAAQGAFFRLVAPEL